MSVTDPKPIYVVDDDDGHAELIEMNLRATGIVNPVARFADGALALAAIRDETRTLPALVLLDLNMPGMNGHRVLSAVRADVRSASLPVVVLTTASRPEEIDACYAEGCNLYLTKPIRYGEFVKAIQLLGQALSVFELPGGRDVIRAV